MADYLRRQMGKTISGYLPMKIVHICHNYIDGQTYQDNELPEAHARLGHEVTVISTLDFAGSVNFPVNRTMADRMYTIGGCKILRLPLRYTSDYRLAVYKGLYQALEAEKPALIYFHGMPYFCYYDIVRYKKRHDCRLVVDFHCDFYNSSHGLLSKWLLHKGLYRAIIRCTRRHVDQYYGVTPGTIDFVQEMYGLPGDRVKLLPLGGNLHTIDAAGFPGKSDPDTTMCDTPAPCGAASWPISSSERKGKIRAALGLTSRCKLLVTAGKIDEGKKTVELIEACQQLDIPDLRLLIIGPVEPQYRLKIGEAAGDDPRILLAGWMQPAEMYRYFQAADLACFPGSQSVLWQQAICCGLPLVCYYWPGSEYLDCGGNIRFLYEQSSAALQGVLHELLTGESKLEAMAEISRTSGRSRFSYDRIAQTVLDDVD